MIPAAAGTHFLSFSRECVVHEVRFCTTLITWANLLKSVTNLNKNVFPQNCLMIYIVLLRTKLNSLGHLYFFDGVRIICSHKNNNMGKYHLKM